jgi:macrolide transport system ATP-binding/permease protein
MKFLWWGRRKQDRELEDEIQSHLEMAKRDRLERGEDKREAERAARREFGNVGLVKDVTRSVWGWRWIEDFIEDARYGLRTLSKNPGFTAIAVLTLALGIGANTAIFSLIDAALLRSLPVRDSNQLVLLEWHANKDPKRLSSSSYGDCEQQRTKTTVGGCSFSQPFFERVRSQTAFFSNVAGFAWAGQLNLSGNGVAKMINQVGYVSGNYFETLGVQPALGRLIAPEDDRPSAPPAIVLSYGYWRSEFGGAPSAIGKTVLINKVPCTIIGVAESRFDALAPGNPFQAWMPLIVQHQLELPWDNREADPANWWLVVVGRLKPDTTRAQAQAAVSTLFTNDTTSGEKPMLKAEDRAVISLTSAEEGLSGNRSDVSAPLYVLLLAVGIVLLIACANVAGLLLSRAAARQKEMAVRFALGASRARIVRQLLTESVMLSIAGGIVGILFATWCIASIATFIATSNEGLSAFQPDINPRVLLFTSAVSIVTGILFGLAPAFRGMRVDLTPVLKEGSGGILPGAHTARGRFGAGNWLVVVQVALSIVILAGAGLLVRTLQNLKSINPGFDTRNMLTFRLDPTLIGYKRAEANIFYRELHGRIATIPGVLSSSYSWSPLLGGGLWTTGFHLAGTPKDEETDTDMLPIGPEFFKTMRITLLDGREFNPADFERARAADEAQAAQREQLAAKLKPGSKPAANATPVAGVGPVPAIVNQAFARKVFPKVNPLGQRFGASEANSEMGEFQNPGWEIVGVVADAKYNSLRRDVAPTTYIPNSGGMVSFSLRTASDPNSFVPLVRSLVNQIDSNLPLFRIKTVSQQIDQQVFKERLIARLAGFFGALALILACIGLYGLVSYEVARRTREIGIRTALGAEKQDVLRLVLGQGMRLALVGAAVGIALAFAIMRYAKSLLFGVGAADPLTFAAVTALLMGVTLLACYVPARRATRVDPVVALRYE